VTGRYVVDENGKRVAVLLSVEEYERMVEELEELEDVRAAAEVRASIERGEEGLIPFDQAMQEIELLSHSLPSSPERNSPGVFHGRRTYKNRHSVSYRESLRNKRWANIGEILNFATSGTSTLKARKDCDASNPRSTA
jgi:PHD/YefM family antitoxin component YafN of YafNO toxin-antitoxin module